MPRRYKKKRYNKYKKKKSSFTKYSGSGLTKSYPLGKKFTFKARYCEVGKSLDNGAIGGGVSKIYRMSSLYDPNYSGLGHQPLGFDQMMLFYDHYTVIGARARINFSNTDGSNPQTVALKLSDEFTVNPDLQNTFENGDTRWTTLSPSDGGQASKTLTINYSAKKFFTKNVLGDDLHQGNVSTNPAENCYLHVIAAGADIAQDTSAVLYDITIDYIAILTEPKSILSS